MLSFLDCPGFSGFQYAMDFSFVEC